MNTDKLFYASAVVAGVAVGLETVFAVFGSGRTLRVGAGVASSLLFVVPSGYLLLNGSTTDQVPSFSAWIMCFASMGMLGIVVLSIL